MASLDDYIQIKYIEANGLAYIDLGSSGRPSRNWSILAVASFKNTSDAYVWGVRDGTSKYYSFYYDNANTAYAWQYGPTADVNYIAQNSLYPSDYPIQITQSRTSNTSSPTYLYLEDYLDPEQGDSYSTNVVYPAAATSTRNMYVLAKNNNGAVANIAPAGTRLYKFKASNDITSEEFFDLVPIRENTDSNPKVGMFNLKNNTAIWAKTSNFIAGPDLDSGSHIWIRQSGSWSEGTPYIRQSGSWAAGKPYIRQSGTWNQGQ